MEFSGARKVLSASISSIRFKSKALVETEVLKHYFAGQVEFQVIKVNHVLKRVAHAQNQS